MGMQRRELRGPAADGSVQRANVPSVGARLVAIICLVAAVVCLTQMGTFWMWAILPLLFVGGAALLPCQEEKE